MMVRINQVFNKLLNNSQKQIEDDKGSRMLQ